MNEDGTPFRTVTDSSLDTINVMITPSSNTASSIAADSTDEKAPDAVTKNMVIMAIIVGKRPLQGTRLFVIMAIRRSRFESIIRQPVTPQALQPNPIAIVIACFPHAPEHRKHRSRLKAIRGRYPASSSRVNMGKKIAMTGYTKNRKCKKQVKTPAFCISFLFNGINISGSNMILIY